jgi:hypothetical protein
MRALILVLFAAGSAAADPAPAKPADAKAEPAKAEPTKCKPHVVGRGLERHVVCEIDVPIIVKQSAPKPGVLIVHTDGRKIVKPHYVDGLEGLSHSLRD